MKFEFEFVAIFGSIHYSQDSDSDSDATDLGTAEDELISGMVVKVGWRESG